jgi:lipopolysaccharide/colanic/teichoic acid biosynthesis glycosyltransferase
MYTPLLKRLLDVVFAAIALIVSCPALLLLTVVVLVVQGRPVLFTHQRVGLHGRPFPLYKFRTMVRDAEKIGPWYTDAGDPRVTPLGRWLRKYSFDEIPQLLNVLLGHMSLVGPRPDTKIQTEALGPLERAKRCSVKPGLTGLAQVSGRSNITAQVRLARDLEYVDIMSLTTDIRIMLRTVGMVLRPGSSSW